MSYSPGWAGGSWFIPFLNLVRPYRILREIWTESAPASTGWALLKGGWALFLIGGVLVAFRVTTPDASTDAEVNAWAHVIGFALRASGACSAFLIIGRITHWQSERAKVS